MPYGFLLKSVKYDIALEISQFYEFQFNASSGNTALGRPNLQKVPKTLLQGTRLQAFSELFFRYGLLFLLEVA